MLVRRPAPARVSGTLCMRAEESTAWSLTRHVKFVFRTWENGSQSCWNGTRGSRVHEEPRRHIARFEGELPREIGRTGGNWLIEGPLFGINGKTYGYFDY
jgi:hypothetical protein